MLQTALGTYQNAVDTALAELGQDNIMHRIWKGDHTVWKDDPTEISNRLGWLHIYDRMEESFDRFTALLHTTRKEGYTHALLLGMGGSSLAPEVFRKTFGVGSDHLDLAVLDSTDPGAVLHYDNTLDLTKTLFIVATKSGGTAETLSAFKYFYNRLLEITGSADETGAHFIAITDPGSKLETMADRFKFRGTFLNDPNIGGRYSALSFFGILPASLIGVDLPRLLQSASQMSFKCDPEMCESEADNAGALLGSIMGELAKAGRDKVTLILSPEIASFGDWVEQLIAESTGKEGKGILPVVGEAVGTPDVYKNDRLFVYMRMDDTYDAAVQALEDAGHPIVRIPLETIYDLGGQFFLWEMATAVAGQRLGINPFDQPNVEAAKVLARQMISAYEQEGKLPELTSTLRANGITVYGDTDADSPAAALKAFIEQGAPDAYISLQAYVLMNEEAETALQAFRTHLRDTYHLATTLGYGPRFLHSTGQLHKGDAGKGLFIQFLTTMPEDVAIPDEAGETGSSMSFGTLKTAQALGDRQALLDEKRHVIRFDLSTIEDVKKLV